MEPKFNYWVVGASFNNGTKDMYDEFILRGYWCIGWDEEDADNKRVKEFLDRVNQIKVNDRIAIKQRLGQGSTTILIRAIGIVKDIDPEDRTIYVNWLVKDIDREVPIHGCFGTIYGPYNYEEDWTKTVFSI